MLYGRDAERTTLAQLLDGVRASRSGVLVIRGEAGVGKSSLLADAIEQAEDMQVVRALGVESESELAYAGLHQLVWPLIRHVEEVPTPQARALQGALGLSTDAGFDRFLVSAALLSVLAAASEERPIFCAVDDAHWLDAPSADALTFAARRLYAEPIALVITAREGEERRFDAPGLPSLELDGLDQESARALLASQVGAGLSADVRDRIVESARGNPLALLELPHGLSAHELAGHEPLTDTLPLNTAIEQAFLRRAKSLPRPAQDLLLLAAADDTGDAAVVFDAARALGIDERAFEATEAAHLVRLRDGVVEFRHPLVRSAVYATASFAERKAVHGALADVLSGEQNEDRRSWHLAATILGTNEPVAEQLEQSAERAVKRSGYGAAAAALERSATLTSDHADRARRLTGAARAAWFAGRSARARTLLTAASRLEPDLALRAEIDHLKALIELQSGVPLVGHELLLAAAEQIAPVDPELAAAMLVSAGEAAAFAGSHAGEVEAGRRAEGLQETLAEPLFELTMMTGIKYLLTGDAETGTSLLRETIAAAEHSENPRRLFWAGSSALYLLDFESARSFFARAAEQTRADGAISMLALALQMLGHADLLDARFTSAIGHASEGLRLAGETGQENGACHHLSILAWAHGALGDEDECRAAAAQALELSAVRSLGLQSSFTLIGLGLLSLGLGQPAEALTHFERVRNAGPGEGHEAFKLLVVPDLVDAAVRAEREELGVAALPAYEAWVTSAASGAELARLTRSKALLGAASFEQALQQHTGTGRPFERARTELAFGESLRRSRKRSEARDHLRAALEKFEQLGAVSWAERARAELRASGETARKRDPSTVDQLTAQELQIARLVAGGATNKEVAAQLFLSPRTIDFHLRNVYSKLGISSRHDLAAFGFADDPATPATAPAISPVRA